MGGGAGISAALGATRQKHTGCVHGCRDASGKTTLAKNDAEWAIVYDSTLSDYPPAERRIRRALDSGKKVRIVYIYRSL